MKKSNIRLALFWWFAFFCNDLSSLQAFPVEVEEAIRSAAWKTVAAVLQKDDSTIGDPVARLLVAHACLAENRNNASLALFLSVDSSEERQRWSDWTDSYLKRNPNHATALFLAADAQARNGELARAIEGFAAALKADPALALARNAKGVAHVLKGELDQAQIEFYVTTKSMPRFADAYLNLGNLTVIRESSLRVSRQGLEYFEAALKIDPEFALAYNGRGCLYFGNADFQRSVADFRRASEEVSFLVIAAVNEGLANTYRSHRTPQVGGPGTTVGSQFTRIQPESDKSEGNGADRELQRKIDAFEHLSNPEQNALIAKYGEARVVDGINARLQGLQAKTVQLNQADLKAHREIGSAAAWAIKLAEAKTLLSAASGLKDTFKNVNEGFRENGWKGLLEKTAPQVGKAYVNSEIKDRTTKAIADGIPGSIDVASLGISAGKNAINAADAVAQDRLKGGEVRQKLYNDETVRNAITVRNLVQARDTVFARMSPVSPAPGVELARVPTTTMRLEPVGLPSRSDLPRGGGPPGGGAAAFPRIEPRIGGISGSRGALEPPKPGGVSTEELANSFVDKGGWPVLTAFSLSYLQRPAEK
jgi:tetratricopeptide (TPR) repeat protein